MAAGEEEGVVAVDALLKDLGKGSGGLPEGGLLVQELNRDLIVFGGFDGGLVQGSGAAAGGGDGDFGGRGGRRKNVVGVGEFGEVPACFFACVGQVGVGGEDYEDGGGHFGRECVVVLLCLLRW